MVELKSFKILAGAALLSMGLIAPFGGTANALPINCAADDVSLEGVDATICESDDASTPSGDAAEIAAMNAIFGSGWVLVGKSDAGGSGVTAGSGNSGVFAIDTSLLVGTDEIAILFKTGGGQNEPDWAGFGLWSVAALNANFIAPGTEYNGLFDLSSWGQNGLSHISVFKRRGQDVPEPGPLGLLGLGIIALYVARRRRLVN